MLKASRDCQLGLQPGSFTHPLAPRAGPATHRSPASAAHTALLRDRCTSRGSVNQRL
ncbi:Hypothetical protein GSB_152684 [Giardia duodenalis]|uniref:Uncharacterized protein n=1 Tax=Giardia intestinalis TaxID=5741 RepID=V6TXI9_GIAIN|nr:Hypothetical protein GSB_152684 [Giardia intestinalis]